MSGTTPLTPGGRLGPARRHPGFSDPAYLARRRALGALAEGHRVGDPSPAVAYSDAEHRTWRAAHAAVTAAQRRYACREVVDAAEAARIPADHVPQHAEVDALLRPLTGFGFTLAGGIVEPRRLYGAMADGWFHSVQYVRHPALPLYSPEPDVVHDLIGHGTQLAAPRFAALYRLVGEAVRRVRTAEAADLASRLFWFTLEYGVVREDGRPAAYGAALLSSYGEIAGLHEREIRPLDLAAMAATPYRISGYQPVLYAARSLDHLSDTLEAFFTGFDGDTAARLRAGGAGRGGAV